MRHGILLIDKPSGWTSHDVVAKARGILGERKIGHLGTLDPLATGLLVLFVGKKALKVLELFANVGKTYEARITFGAVSTTYDAEGVIEAVAPKPGWTEPAEPALNTLLQSPIFSGEITQTPPAHSAIHIDGQRAYDIIRADPDADIDIPERTVHIDQLQLLSYRYPEACIRITCSSGTYIRSLAHDIGQQLRCGAYLSALRRTHVGAWSVDDAHSIEHVQWGHVQPLKEVLPQFARHDLTDEEWTEVQHGRTIIKKVMDDPLIAWHNDLPVALLERAPKGRAHPRKVL